MKQAEKTKGIATEARSSSMTALLKGVLIAYCITAIVFLAYAVLITYTSMSENYLSVVSAGTTIVAVIVAGFDAARGARSRGWLWGIAAGAVYALILLLIMSVVQKGFYYDSRTVTLIILALSGGGLGGVIGINFRK
ncbi:MAG: TIGR04086 family membrane protein [Firmicutes bacterium]|nr:TIGR04086 family membrane protein [Bacillota bacterium]